MAFPPEDHKLFSRIMAGYNNNYVNTAISSFNPADFHPADEKSFDDEIALDLEDEHRVPYYLA